VWALMRKFQAFCSSINELTGVLCGRRAGRLSQ
jgi:hypothetical protein